MTCFQPPLRRRLLLAAVLSIACDAPPTEPAASHPMVSPSGRLTLAGSPTSIALSSRGAGYVTLLDRLELARFDAAAPTSLASPIPIAVQPRHVVFNRDGTTAFVAAWDRDRQTVYSVDVASGDVPFARPMGGSVPYRAVLSKDESRLFLLSYGDPSRVFSIPIASLFDAQTYMTTIPGVARGLAVSPTTGALFVATSARVARLEPDASGIQEMGVPTFVGSEDVAVSPDGRRVWFGSPAGTLIALDASSLEKVAEVATGANVRGLAMSPDGAQLWATSLGDLLVVDPALASIVTRVTLGGAASHIAFDRAGTTAFVANESGWVDVIR